MRRTAPLSAALAALIALGIALPAAADHHEADAAEAAAPPQAVAPPEPAPAPTPGSELSVVDPDVGAQPDPAAAAAAAEKARLEQERKNLERAQKLLRRESTSSVGAEWSGGGEM